MGPLLGGQLQFRVLEYLAQFWHSATCGWKHKYELSLRPLLY